MLRVVDHAIDSSDRQAGGIHAVSAAGDDLFSGLNTFVRKDVDDFRLAGRVATKDAAQTCLRQDDAEAAGLIVNFEHLGGAAKHVAHLAHYAIGSDDRHIRFEAVLGAFIDHQHARQIGAAGADDVGRTGLRDVLLLKAEQFLQAQTFAGIDGQRRLFQPHAIQLRLQLLVLLADMSQVHIIVPGMADAMADGKKYALEWRKGSDHPIADEPRLLAVFPRIRAPHLHGKTQQLHQHDRQQDQWISVAAEKRFHGAMSAARSVYLAARRIFGEGQN